ncbi:MAG: hypothetical protein HY901_16655 [Deltaproteobacteria bacterium]|nr:hypothetical protein [Deltaproteobacteria bacterium]
MNPLPLARLDHVAALQHGRTLYLHVVGRTSGLDGSLHILRDENQDHPASFAVFERPGNCGITGECHERVVLAGAAFEGRFPKIQVRSAYGTQHPTVVSLPKLVPSASAARATGASVSPGDDRLAAGEWHAWENHQGEALTLHVRGVVVLPSPGHTATLVEATPPGINPSVLLLELRVTAPAKHAEVMTPTPVSFEKRADREYAAVHIRETGETVYVEHVF